MTDIISAISNDRNPLQNSFNILISTVTGALFYELNL